MACNLFGPAAVCKCTISLKVGYPPAWQVINALSLTGWISTYLVVSFKHGKFDLSDMFYVKLVGPLAELSVQNFQGLVCCQLPAVSSALQSHLLNKPNLYSDNKNPLDFFFKPAHLCPTWNFSCLSGELHGP